MPSATSDADMHIVLDDFGRAGRAYRETDAKEASFDVVVDDLLSGQFTNPVRVVAFNTAEGWMRDVSKDVAREMVMRAADRGVPLADRVRRFVDRYVDEVGVLRAVDNRIGNVRNTGDGLRGTIAKLPGLLRKGS